MAVILAICFVGVVGIFSASFCIAVTDGFRRRRSAKPVPVIPQNLLDSLQTIKKHCAVQGTCEKCCLMLDDRHICFVVDCPIEWKLP